MEKKITTQRRGYSLTNVDLDKLTQIADELQRTHTDTLRFMIHAYKLKEAVQE